ncbi:MAG: hypothetical protein QXH92_03805 [Candidatus Aenigmatarchaeota archaeon]
MISLDALIGRYDRFRNLFVDDFMKYCREKGEPCSVAYIGRTVIDEDHQIDEPYVNVIIIRDIDNKNIYNSFFMWPNLNSLELHFFIVSDDLTKKLSEANIKNHGYDNTIQLELFFENFECCINIWPNMLYIYDNIRCNDSTGSPRKSNTDLLYNSISNDL